MPSPTERPTSAAIAGDARSSWQLRKQVVLVAVVVVVISYLGFVRYNTSYLASNSDASGYFNVARALGSRALVQPVPRIEGLAPPQWDYFYQQPLGFLVNRNRGTMVPTYPVGFPLHLLAASPLFGLDYGVLAVNVFLAAAAAALMVLMGRQLACRGRGVVQRRPCCGPARCLYFLRFNP